MKLKPIDWLIIALVIVILFMFLTPFGRENFGMGGGAKFKISGRKNKCACGRNCDLLHYKCINRPDTYTRDYCDRQLWTCKKTCFLSDYGS